jgi:hypothetical protein
MNPPGVRIGNINIRVPGLSPAAARGLADDVAARLAANVGTAQPGRVLNTVQIRVPASANRSSTLADTIAARIIEVLR